ncbi:MAG: DNA mismatch repair protein MutS [Gammaproteobacteria bacterium]|nr:MAG: DNA mismatch repair protein MutS [Gammaproteobacteria bacterium]
MRALLMHCDRDFDLQQELPRHQQALRQDLELDTLLRAMASDDAFLFDVAYKALVSAPGNDVDTILYRQEILKDCLNNPAVVRELYDLAVEAVEAKKKHHLGIWSRYPGAILHGAIEMLQMFKGMLERLKRLADMHAGRFESRGFTALFAMLEEEFSDEYFARIQTHLTELKFRAGVLLSAELGPGNEGTNYVLRLARDKRPAWLKSLLGKGPPAYTFRIADRDDAGARALSELKDRGINPVANALAQSTDHILSFFEMLRKELAFYVGCLNLHARLVRMGAPMSFPRPQAAGARRHRYSELYDVCLALSMGRSVVGNTHDADRKSLVIITGANQGGKSCFLRAIGLAQLMMQCGMFVAAEFFAAELCTGLFSHYKREEDATMKSGKLDEELGRMSDIVDSIAPNSMVLFNESFASTNEREGSEIARQVVCALLERRIKIFFVTHLYEFAHGFFDRKMEDAIFLRAERRSDGTRTFRLVEGEPLETSYGEDLYREIFQVGTKELSAG